MLNYLEVTYTPQVRQRCFIIRVEVPDDYDNDQILAEANKVLLTAAQKEFTDLPYTETITRGEKVSLDFVDASNDPPISMLIALEPKYYFDCVLEAKSSTRFTVEVKADNLEAASDLVEEYMREVEDEAEETSREIWERMTVDAIESKFTRRCPSDVDACTTFRAKLGVK
jgi:hypothetical protein